MGAAVAQKQRCSQYQYPRLPLLRCLGSLAVGLLLPLNLAVEGASRVGDILGALKLYQKKALTPKRVYGGCALDWGR